MLYYAQSWLYIVPLFYNIREHALLKIRLLKIVTSLSRVISSWRLHTNNNYSNLILRDGTYGGYGGESPLPPNLQSKNGSTMYVCREIYQTQDHWSTTVTKKSHRQKIIVGQLLTPSPQKKFIEVTSLKTFTAIFSRHT